MGYGLSSHIHTSKFRELREKLPVVIEMIDSTEKTEEFYNLISSELSDLPKGCLVTISPTEVKLRKFAEKSRQN